MRCRLLRNLDAAPRPGGARHPNTVIEQRKRRGGGTIDVEVFPAGTVISHPDAYRLCLMLVAEPADEECEKLAVMSLEQRTKAEVARRRLDAGIHPDDFEKFDKGLISGYAENGTAYKPGPLADLMTEDDDDE